MHLPMMLTLFTIITLSLFLSVQANVEGESGLSRRRRHIGLRADTDAAPPANNNGTSISDTATRTGSSSSTRLTTGTPSSSSHTTSHSSRRPSATPNDDNGDTQKQSSSRSSSSTTSSSSSSSPTPFVISNTNSDSLTQTGLDPTPATTIFGGGDDFSSTTDEPAPTDQPDGKVAANNNAFLANRSAVAAVSSIAAIAGVAALGFGIILLMRRRARQRRSDKWRRSTWFTGHHPDPDFDGFEKVEPGGGVPMGELHGNESRDYFAPGEFVVHQSQRLQESNVDYPPPTGFGSPGHNNTKNPYWSSSPAVDYPPVAASRGQTYSGIEYPPAMVYSPEAHDAHDAAQQNRLNELHKYTLEPISPTSPIHADGYQPSPLALSRQRTFD